MKVSLTLQEGTDRKMVRNWSNGGKTKVHKVLVGRQILELCREVCKKKGGECASKTKNEKIISN